MRSFTHFLLFSLATVAISGCGGYKTQAEKQVEIYHSQRDIASQAWAECWEKSASQYSKESKIISTILVSGPNDPDAWNKKTNENFPNENHREAAKTLWSASQHCDTKYISDLQAVSLRLAEVTRTRMQRRDRIRVSMLSGNVSIGELNRLYEEDSVKWEREWVAAYQADMKDFSQAHNAQIQYDQQRANAISEALSEYARQQSQQQQTLPSPTHTRTTCRQVGNSVECTTY